MLYINVDEKPPRTRPRKRMMMSSKRVVKQETE